MIIEKLLNIKYPIIQGGMANIATSQLCAAVSNAGGLGLIGSGGWDKEKLREEIKKTRELTDKPFGVNLMLMNPHIEDLAVLMVEENIKIITTGAGNPGKFMESWKNNGAIVIPVVPSVSLGKRMERIGADAVIVEGTEAGGHIGELTTMCLTPQAVDALSIPVIAAGGIADGRGVAASFALGAVGVQVGTAFLVASECPVHQNYKDRLVKAKDTDTIVTGRGTGAPVRVIKNKMAREYIKIAASGIDLHKLEQLTLGSLRKAVLDGDIDHGSVMAGQSAGLLKNIKTCKEIIEDMFNEYNTVISRLK